MNNPNISNSNVDKDQTPEAVNLEPAGVKVTQNSHFSS